VGFRRDLRATAQDGGALQGPGSLKDEAKPKQSEAKEEVEVMISDTARLGRFSPAVCLEQTGVEFSKGSNQGDAQGMSRRFGRTTSTKSKAGAYRKGVGLGISVLLTLIVISLAVWLLRRSARDESTPATPEPGEGVEAGVEEALVGEASTSGEAGKQKDKAQATPAAERKAEDLGVDLSQIEGTGSGGRITVKDVTEAAKQA
jgi:pyruvate/2-oxoglutarate dehydrogenase complex dihydrolipoamide acyltransferase (E2) component